MDYKHVSLKVSDDGSTLIETYEIDGVPVQTDYRKQRHSLRLRLTSIAPQTRLARTRDETNVRTIECFGHLSWDIGYASSFSGRHSLLRSNEVHLTIYGGGPYGESAATLQKVTFGIRGGTKPHNSLSAKERKKLDWALSDGSLPARPNYLQSSESEVLECDLHVRDERFEELWGASKDGFLAELIVNIGLEANPNVFVDRTGCMRICDEKGEQPELSSTDVRIELRHRAFKLNYADALRSDHIGHVTKAARALRAEWKLRNLARWYRTISSLAIMGLVYVVLIGLPLLITKCVSS